MLGMFGHAVYSCLLLHSKYQNLIGTPSKSFDFHSSDMHWFKNSSTDFILSKGVFAKDLEPVHSEAQF